MIEVERDGPVEGAGHRRRPRQVAPHDLDRGGEVGRRGIAGPRPHGGAGRGEGADDDEPRARVFRAHQTRGLDEFKDSFLAHETADHRDDDVVVANAEVGPEHGRSRRRNPSEYLLQLQEKQKARFTYGLNERQFRRLYDEANKTKGVTGEQMLQLLERRLDNIVYRAGWAATRPQARHTSKLSPGTR